MKPNAGRENQRANSNSTQRLVIIGELPLGYLFNTGEMNPRNVPEENMRTMIQALREDVL